MYRALSGLRRGEIAGLKWSDIDFDAETITVARSRVELGKRRSAFPQIKGVLFGAPSGFRTPDPLIKSQLLYQLS